MKERIVKLDFNKMECFFCRKDIVKRIKRQAMEKEIKSFKGKSAKGLFCKIYKDLSKLENKETNNSIKKWTKDFTNTSPKKINHENNMKK